MRNIEMSEMTKIVYSACYGGFSLSEKAINRYWELKGEPCPEDWWGRDLERTDPILVQVVEELGDSASGRFANLQICELEKGTLYRIDEYDGYESVMTQGDYVWKVA